MKVCPECGRVKPDSDNYSTCRICYYKRAEAERKKRIRNKINSYLIREYGS